MKRQVKPSDHIFLGMIVITLEVIFTWYYYVKNKLRQSAGTTQSESGITDEAFEEELARSSATNGNGTVASDAPCPCEDTPDPSPTDLGEEEEPEPPVPSLPEEPSSDLAETDSPETDQH